jgi:hydrogenase nickel incorporation protein HypA/HybF
LKCRQGCSFQGSVKILTMHEIKIAEDLTRIVLKAANKEKLSKVTMVNIAFGQLIQIVPEIFEFAFRETVRDTIARDARVNIELVPVIMRCRDCSCEFQVKDNFFGCSECGSKELDILNGKELFIKSIEGE